jgi:hypothetical protein
MSKAIFVAPEKSSCSNPSRFGHRRSIQSYAISNILSAQFYAAALKAHPASPAKSPAAGLGRCTLGYAIIFTGTAASSCRTISVDRATGAMIK